jgi:hypothetical protein
LTAVAGSLAGDVAPGLQAAAALIGISVIGVSLRARVSWLRAQYPFLEKIRAKAAILSLAASVKSVGFGRVRPAEPIAFE